MSMIPHPSRATHSWAGMSPELQRMAREALAEALRQQVSESEAVILAAILPGVDLSALAVSSTDAGAILGTSAWRAQQLRHEGRLPLMLELWAPQRGGGVYCTARAFWRPVCEAWREYRDRTPYRGGYGRRWEP